MFRLERSGTKRFNKNLLTILPDKVVSIRAIVHLGLHSSL